MARGSLLMGTQRGKLGDAILYRQKGQQVARAYVPRISNPRTSRQLYQRMFVATAAKAMSQMHNIINHSFQNVQAGADCLNHFQKRNIALLRDNSKFDQDTQQWVSSSMSFVPPKSIGMTWNPYIMSSGSLRPLDNYPAFLLNPIDEDGIFADSNYTRLSVPLFGFQSAESRTPAEFFLEMDAVIRAYGGRLGDYFTVCVISARREDVYGGAGVFYPCDFHYVRFQVIRTSPENFPVLTLAATNIDGQNFNFASLEDVSTKFMFMPFHKQAGFQPYLYLAATNSNGVIGSAISNTNPQGFEAPLTDSDTILAYCWIHSRSVGDSWLCSSQKMILADKTGDVYESNLMLQDAYEEWLSIVRKVGDAPVILDGGTNQLPSSDKD